MDNSILFTVVPILKTILELVAMLCVAVGLARTSWLAVRNFRRLNDPDMLGQLLPTKRPRGRQARAKWGRYHGQLAVVCRLGTSCEHTTGCRKVGCCGTSRRGNAKLPQPAIRICKRAARTTTYGARPRSVLLMDQDNTMRRESLLKRCFGMELCQQFYRYDSS
jgi:hypothetical protein